MRLPDTPPSRESDRHYDSYHVHILNRYMVIKSSTKLHPLTVPSMIGQNIKNLLAPEKFKVFKRRFNRTWHKGEITHLEYRILGIPTLAIMVKSGNGVLVHEANNVDLRYKDKVMFELKKAAVVLDHEMFHREVI